MTDWRPYIEYKSDKEEPQLARIYCIAESYDPTETLIIFSRCSLTCKKQGFCSCGEND